MKAGRRVGQTRRRDQEEDAIVRALVAIGVVVLRVSGPGAPDLLGYRGGRWLPMEVKSRRGTLTIRQQNTRVLAPFPVVRSVAEALALWGVTVTGVTVVPS